MTSLEIDHKNDQYLHLDLEVSKRSINKLFDEVSRYDLRYMKDKPFTLEDHYTEIIDKRGKISA